LPSFLVSSADASLLLTAGALDVKLSALSSGATSASAALLAK
jgi:hypothetical protein